MQKTFKDVTRLTIAYENCYKENKQLGEPIVYQRKGLSASICKEDCLFGC